MLFLRDGFDILYCWLYLLVFAMKADVLLHFWHAQYFVD